MAFLQNNNFMMFSYIDAYSLGIAYVLIPKIRTVSERQLLQGQRSGLTFEGLPKEAARCQMPSPLTLC